MTPAPVIQLRSDSRCRICAHPAREAVESLYARIGEVDPVSGKRITLALCVSSLGRVIMGDAAPSVGSWKRHFQGATPHAQVVTVRDAARQDRADREQAQAEVDEETEALLAEIERLLESERPSADGVMSVQLRAYLLDTKRRVAAGHRVSLTHDQAVRAAQALLASQRAHGETSLLSVLGQAIAASAQRSLGPRDTPALPSGDVVEVEAVEVGS